MREWVCREFPFPLNEGEGVRGRGSKHRFMRPNSRNLKNISRARTLRQKMTYSERVLWASLRRRELGFRFRRQVPVGPYILDFFCPAAMLCVETDGEQHQFSQANDRKRDAYLLTLGIETFRIPTFDLFDGFTYTTAYQRLHARLLERAAEQEMLKTEPPSPDPFPLVEGEGGTREPS